MDEIDRIELVAAHLGVDLEYTDLAETRATVEARVEQREESAAARRSHESPPVDYDDEAAAVAAVFSRLSEPLQD